jgi:hypothetical protein
VRLIHKNFQYYHLYIIILLTVRRNPGLWLRGGRRQAQPELSIRRHAVRLHRRQWGRGNQDRVFSYWIVIILNDKITLSKRSTRFLSFGCFMHTSFILSRILHPEEIRASKKLSAHGRKIFAECVLRLPDPDALDGWMEHVPSIFDNRMCSD